MKEGEYKMEIIYSDKMGSRSRSSWAIIVGPGDELELFTGKSIPGKVAIVGEDYKKAGKWSHSTYRLVLAEGIQFISGHMGWETGTFVEGLASATGMPADRWHEVANALGVSLPVAQEFLRGWRPKAAEKLDQIEADLASLDETSSTGAVTISITYGAPTQKLREQGFWEWPVRILNGDGREVGRVSPEGEASGEVRVLKRQEASGHGGGYVSLMLAVPEGCRAKHGPVPGENRAEQEASACLPLKMVTAVVRSRTMAIKDYPYGRARIYPMRNNRVADPPVFVSCK